MWLFLSYVALPHYDRGRAGPGLHGCLKKAPAGLMPAHHALQVIDERR
jgi:hypothetical protein